MRIRFLLFLSLVILLLLSACSAEGSASTPVPDGAVVSAPQTTGNPGVEDKPNSPPENAAKNNIPSSPPQNMVAFEGEVFVTTTELVGDLWRMSGWNLSDAPIDTDQSSAPLDCTIYPHAGVDGQWVGGCRGYVLIPKNGAKHIAVVVTEPDGSTQMIQVAPDTNSP